MSIGVKAKQLGGELREKAKELGQKVEAKALEAQGKLQDKLFDGKLGQVIGGNHSDFTDKVVSKLNLSAFKDAPPPPVLTRPVVMIPGLTCTPRRTTRWRATSPASRRTARKRCTCSPTASSTRARSTGR